MANNNDGSESRNDVKRPRRRYSAEEKRRLLDEAEKPGESVSTVARRYGVAPNPKRIYRIMKRNKLLLERCTGDGRGRKHDGVLVTLKPNLRWCSDSFEIRCWSGERSGARARDSGLEPAAVVLSTAPSSARSSIGDAVDVCGYFFGRPRQEPT